MMNSLVRSSDNDRFSPRGPMDENQHLNENSWPDRDSHYKLKLLQQQLLQQQPVVSSSMYEEYLHSSIHNNATCSTAASSSSSPLMVLAAAAAATDTMDHSTKYSLDFSSSTMQYPFDNTNSNDPINCMTGSTATPFCTTDLFADKRTVAMTMTSSPPYFPYSRCDTTLSLTNSVSAAGLACLAAVSSHARDVAAAATPCRMESMLVDEQKCLTAMSSVPSYSHPLFTTTTPSSSKVGSAGMASRPMVITLSTPMIPVHDTEDRRFNVRWDDNEDERLKQAIELEGHAWTLIATKHFGNTRNKHQCKSRWSKQLDPALTRVAWTNEEDETITRLQEQRKGWPEIAHELPGRTAEQINYRFTNHLDPTLLKLPFTAEEKAILMKTVAQCGEPKNWKEIANAYFPGKSALQVKNCWHNAKKSKKKGRTPICDSATTTTTITPVPPNVNHAIQARFLVPESANTSPGTRSRSRAVAQKRTVQTPAVSLSPLFQLPVGNTDSHSSTPSVARVDHAVADVSLNATSAKTRSGGRSRSRSRGDAKKPPMTVSSPPRSHSFVRWSMREDEILKQAIELEGPVWEVIATKYFGNTRSVEQCKNRWTKHKDPSLRIGSWTQEEDATISLGKAQGLKFSTIASELQGRTAEGVRNRYNNHLDPTLNKTKFSEEEKAIIMQVAAQYGEPKNWALITKHVPGRSVLQVKNYWHNTSKRSGGAVVKKAKKKKNDRQHGGVLCGSPGKKAKKQHQEQVDRDLTDHY